VGRDGFVDGISVRAIRHADRDVGVFQPEARVNIRGDLVIRPEDIEEVDIDEMVKRINVLLDKPLDFEECREQEPFVLY